MVFCLKNYLHIHAHFLAMAELKQVSLCSSGLTKTLDFILRFSRHGRLETSFTLLIWLDENVLFLVSAVFFCRIDVKEHACHDK